jgi:hypothetical protein
MGFEVLGDNDSPVMPIMLYNPAKIPAFSRECLRQKVSKSFFPVFELSRGVLSCWFHKSFHTSFCHATDKIL